MRKKSEIVTFETNLTKAEHAIESLPECTDATQGARQLSQLEGIRHDVAQIKKKIAWICWQRIHSQRTCNRPMAMRLALRKKRSAKSAQIEGSIKKWDESADLLNQIELWCQKKGKL